MVRAPTVHLLTPRGLCGKRPSASADQCRVVLLVSLFCADRMRLTDLNEGLHTDCPECIILVLRYTDQTPQYTIRQGYPLGEDGDKYADGFLCGRCCLSGLRTPRPRMRASPTTSRCGSRGRRWSWEHDYGTDQAESLFSFVDAFGVSCECAVPSVHVAGECQIAHRINSHSIPDSSMIPHD
jgi:hypothetical protein